MVGLYDWYLIHLFSLAHGLWIVFFLCENFLFRALDFDGNLERVIASIREAKAKGARLRVGPELELCGYSCEDHFLELDLYRHCNESLCRLLSSDVTCDILCDIGCPFLFNGVRYNCKVYCLDKKIVFIRPKMALAEDGNYRENRYFTSWKSVDHCASFVLPPEIQEVTSQREVPFGFAFIKASDSSIGCEICEELWAPSNPHQMQFLHGVDIICNGSGSHHRLRKLDNRIKLIQSATSKCGGAYLYSNLRGCDGGRLYFDGSSMINVNGKWLSQASQFSFVDVEVITALIDLNEITAFRQGSGILQLQSSIYQSSISPVSAVPSIEIKFSLCSSRWNRSPLLPPTHLPHLFSPEEECIFGPSCWLWDYLRRSKADGFLLPLSGGADSAAVASIVYVMCCRAIDEASRGNTQVQEDLKRWIKNDNHAEVINSGSLLLIDAENKKESNDSFLNKHYLGWSPLNLCHEILHTVYLGSDNSSTSTNQRASQLSKEIGSYHCNLPIESVVQVCLTTFSVLTGGKKPRYECQGGTKVEDLALQNLQARIRMVLSYLCAQLFPWIRNPSSPGFLLVLGAANVDEALRGYMTKYDCSSADLNPIG